MRTLLAVDLGLSTALALYAESGRLLWYRSRRFASLASLRRGVVALLRDTGALTYLVLEGDRSLADIWEREARRHGCTVLRVSAETWREQLLLPRERVRGQTAKSVAQRKAEAIARSWGLGPRTPLNADTAEAVLIGLWGLREVGWAGEAGSSHEQAAMQLPPDIAARLSPLLGDAWRSPHDLEDEINGYLDWLGRYASPEIHAEAQRLAAILVEWLHQVDDHTSDADRALLQAAAVYFIIREDDHTDTEPGGLDDDFEVVRAVGRVLGKGEV